MTAQTMHGIRDNPFGTFIVAKVLLLGGGGVQQLILVVGSSTPIELAMKVPTGQSVYIAPRIKDTRECAAAALSITSSL